MTNGQVNKQPLSMSKSAIPQLPMWGVVGLFLTCVFMLSGAGYFFNLSGLLMVELTIVLLLLYISARGMLLLKSVSHYAYLWDSVPAIVLETRLDGVITVANKNFDGGSGNILLGANLLRLNVMRRNDKVRDLMGGLSSESPFASFDVGQYFVRMLLKNDEKHIVVMFTDSDDRGVSAPTERMKEICVQEYFDISRDLLSIVNKETGRFVYFNPAWSNLLGYDDDELFRMSVSKLMHPADGEDESLPIIEFEDFYSRNVTKHGEVVWLRWSSSRSKVSRFLHITARNVSKQRHAEMSLDVSQKELARHQGSLEKLVDEQTIDLLKAKILAEKAGESKSEFLANMSHELRTPLHAIVGFTNMGLNEVNVWSADQITENYTRILNSGERLLVLLDNLLDVSKFEFGMMELHIDRHHFADMVEHVRENLSSLLEGKSITLIVEAQHNRYVECDRLRIEQVLVNLISNAIKFSPDGADITLRIGEGVVKQGRRKFDAVKIEVIDSGIGIPLGEEQLVFSKFVQSSKTATEAGGTGLGLSICKEIVTLHGGEISAKLNDSGKGGSCFTMFLPFKTLFQRG